jgi:hypothetical protein
VSRRSGRVPDLRVESTAGTAPAHSPVRTTPGESRSPDEVRPGSPAQEWADVLLLLFVGVGTRVGFALAYPTRPFFDFLQVVHFGTLLRDQGLFARGWYWSQFNPGLPVILAVLFRIFPGDPVAVARMATAVATGLCPILPFLLWRSVLGPRWRRLAGLLLAAWPGQIFFSGAVALDNWVLLPAVALACLAVRRLLDPTERVYPFVGGVLYAAALAIRQEMALVLLPAALAAVAVPRLTRKSLRNVAVLGVIAGLTFLAIGAQRSAATGHFKIGSEHGALGLFGTFVPGASIDGWSDARAYAAALDPSVVDGSLFGSQPAMLRLTWSEARRRPAFHLLRIAAWVPRLALNADADNLVWSVGAPRAQPADRRDRAAKFRDRWDPILRAELALTQGLFVATFVLGVRRRSLPILTLALSVVLKFLIHAIISPVGRLAVPAIALELLAIPLGLALLAPRPRFERLRFAALAGSTAILLLAGTPALADFVMRHDSPVLPGIRGFALQAGQDCEVRCKLASGAITGLTPAWVRLQVRDEEAAAPEAARLPCAIPVLAAGESLILELFALTPAPASPDAAVTRVLLDGREAPAEAFSAGSSPGSRAVRIFGSTPPHISNVTVELAAPDRGLRPPRSPASMSVRFWRIAPVVPTARPEGS